MTCNVSLEPILGGAPMHLMRCHPNGGAFGDDFDAVALILSHGDTAEVKGLLIQGGEFTLELYRAAMMALHTAGYDKALWDRRKNGKIRQVLVRTLPKPVIA